MLLSSRYGIVCPIEILTYRRQLFVVKLVGPLDFGNKGGTSFVDALTLPHYCDIKVLIKSAFIARIRTRR